MIAGYAVPDFVSEFWHYYIAALTVLGILFSLFLLKSQTTTKLAEGEQAEVMAPTWDGDLQELNNPLPRWWMWMFYGLIFSVSAIWCSIPASASSPARWAGVPSRSGKTTRMRLTRNSRRSWPRSNPRI
jgi:hypothetical protein